MKIYFLGVGGTAMGNLAILMQAQGHTVSGADAKLYPPMSDLLQQSKIEIREGYDPQHLIQKSPDLVVVGNVITRGNATMEWLLNTKKFPYCSLPELIHHHVIANRDAIVITGTHGKTTTTALTTYLFQENNLHPGYFIGGVPLNFPSGAYYGTKSSPFIIEGDEYDSAFFDKRSKFIHYSPKILIINNIEEDHLDIFRDLADIQRSFSHLIRIVPSEGCIIANGDSDTVRALLPVSWTQTIFVGTSDTNDVVITDEIQTDQGTTFSLKNEDTVLTLQSPIFGHHNVRNVAMAVTALYAYHRKQGAGLNLDLHGFKGVKKRQEVIFNNGRTVIIEDFAHHPTAIAKTIEAIRQAFPEHQIITAFEPRSNTACSDFFQSRFIDAFRGSDEAYVSQIFKNKVHGLDVERLVREIHTCPAFATDPEKIKATFPQKVTGQKQVFLFLSNGDFSNVARHLRDAILA